MSPEHSEPAAVLTGPIRISLRQRRRCGQCLAEDPVQSVTDDRLAVPVHGVDQAGRAIDPPRIVQGSGEELSSGWNKSGTASAGGLQVCEQTCPLQSMPRRGAEGLERVIRPIAMVIQLRGPAGVVMGSPPLMLR